MFSIPQNFGFLRTDQSKSTAFETVKLLFVTVQFDELNVGLGYFKDKRIYLNYLRNLFHFIFNIKFVIAEQTFHLFGIDHLNFGTRLNQLSKAVQHEFTSTASKSVADFVNRQNFKNQILTPVHRSSNQRANIRYNFQP